MFGGGAVAAVEEGGGKARHQRRPSQTAAGALCGVPGLKSASCLSYALSGFRQGEDEGERRLREGA